MEHFKHEEGKCGCLDFCQRCDEFYQTIVKLHLLQVRALGLCQMLFHCALLSFRVQAAYPNISTKLHRITE